MDDNLILDSKPFDRFKHINLPKNRKDFENKTFLVLGSKVTGKSVVSILGELKSDIYWYDKNFDDNISGLNTKADSINFVNDGDLEDENLWKSIDYVITSPGINSANPIIKMAIANDFLPMSDIDFAWHLNENEIFGPRKTWIAITGTNGKTTTTRLITSILNSANIPAISCGNIGIPVLSALQNKNSQTLVLEVSSFQLHWSYDFKADIALILNIAPDHIDFHGSFDRYASAKMKLKDSKQLILGVDDPFLNTVFKELIEKRKNLFGFTKKAPIDNQIGIIGTTVAINCLQKEKSLGELPDEVSQPVSLVLNSLAAISVGVLFNIDYGSILNGLKSFQLDPHRMQMIKNYKSVRIIDDSKATNPHAALVAFENYKKVIWVAGGLLKGADIKDLIKSIHPKLFAVILFGKDQAIYTDALKQIAPNVPCYFPQEDLGINQNNAYGYQILAKSVSYTKQIIDQNPNEEIDAVLLSPAAASMDLFESYAQRGDMFTQLVNANMSDGVE